MKVINIYVLASKECQDDARKYASWLTESMAMLPEKRGHRFVLRKNILPLIFRRKNSVAVIYDIIYDFFPEAYSKFFRSRLHFAIKCALRLAPKIIVPSESAKNDILKFYNADRNKIFVAHNKAEEIKISDKEKKFDFPYFLYVGRLELRKNILGILRAFDLFKAEYKSPYKLILAGDYGFGEEKIKETMVRHRFKNDIIFINKFSEDKINQLFSEANVFLQPSFYESDGGEILRAQSYGLPVITSCISSMPEIAGEGVILVSPHDIEEMKEAMIRIAADKNMCEHLSRKSSENYANYRA